MDEPFVETKIVFRNEKTEDLWSPRLKRMVSLYRETEFETFRRGLRDAFIYVVHSEKLEESYDFLRKYDLLYYPMCKSAPMSGPHSHTTSPPEPGKEFLLYGAVVKRKNKSLGDAFARCYESGEKDEHIGRLLGYPDCCRRFFSEVFHTSIDPMYESAIATDDVRVEETAATVKAHPICNLMLRYFGLRISPHLPHSMNCRKTVRTGEKWLDLMRKIDIDAAQWLYEVLSMPLSWECHEGIAVIKTPLFIGTAISDKKPVRHKVINLGWGSLLGSPAQL